MLINEITRRDLLKYGGGYVALGVLLKNLEDAGIINSKSDSDTSGKDDLPLIDINVLKNSSKEEVEIMQRFLRHQGHVVTVDGNVGPQTLKAAEKYNQMADYKNKKAKEEPKSEPKLTPTINKVKAKPLDKEKTKSIIQQIMNLDKQIIGYGIDGTTVGLRIDPTNMPAGYNRYLRLQGKDPERYASPKAMLQYYGFNDSYKNSIKKKTGAEQVFFYIGNTKIY